VTVSGVTAGIFKSGWTRMIPTASSACRAGANEVADAIEETKTVVRGKVGARVEARGTGARKGIRRNDRAGGVFCSVDAESGPGRGS
jgi:hypothetical protein